jgi:acyl carrier protein
MLAVDLEGTFSPVTLSTRLAEFKLPTSVDAAQVSKVLASTRGMTIIIGRESLDECIASFEFGESPDAIQPMAVELLAEILRRNGTEIHEVSNWKATVKDNTLSFRGTIGADSFDSLLGIFSLEQQVDRALPAQEEVAASEPTSASSSGPNATASKKYFDDVQAHIEKVRNYSAQTSGYRAKWNDQQARKIDELGTLHVDPDLVNYGQDVANLLRGNALTIRTGNIEAGATKAEQSLYNGGYYGYSGPFGYSAAYYDPNTSLDYQRVTDARARAAASSDYRTTLKWIDEMSSVMRKAMTARYNVQF